MEQGKFAYRANLEAARKALLDKAGSEFKTPTAKQQTEGLMRPTASSPSEGSGVGVGLSIMDILAQHKAIDKSLRPQSRPDSTVSESLRPKERPRVDSDIMSRDSDLESFGAKLKQSESSGRDDIQITIDDGRTMTGGYQFSDDRLTDYMEANKAKFTTEQFKNDVKLQEKVFKWHISDIDKVIAKIPGSDKMSLDGLRAVAHLGGNTGMTRFVESGGKHNPSDKFGTRLSDYYNKFK